jgi:hypothetical protein
VRVGGLYEYLVGSWWVAETNDYADADWYEWAGQVDTSKYGQPGSVSHFERWAYELIFEDGRKHAPEQYFLDFVADLFTLSDHDYGIGPKFEENWLIIPEGNSKSTGISQLALYHLETVRYPWVPVAASARDQAEILFGQALGFVERTPGLKYQSELNPHGPYDAKGTRQLNHRYSGGKGMKVYAADQETADGVIPTLPIIDEGHRLRDLGLYRLWKGKLNKRHGQIVMISTAGVPGRDFEKTRKKLKTAAHDVKRRGQCFGRYATETTVLHDYAVPSVSAVEDFEIVKEANPLSTITIGSLRSKRQSPSLDFGEGWLRLTCNIAARSSKAAVHDAEWDEMLLKKGEWEEAPDARIPEGVPISIGLDVAWILDTIGIAPLWMCSTHRRLLGPGTIIEPPRDGRQISSVVLHDEIQRIARRNPIYLVAMDTSKAEETYQWLLAGGDDGELGDPLVVDRTQGNKHAAEDYVAFMEAIRGGAQGEERVTERWLRYTGEPDRVVNGITGDAEEVAGAARTHVMNAIARKLPSDKYRFDRESPSRAEKEQDNRVIDYLQAAAMVNRQAAADFGNEAFVPLIAVR